MATLFARQWVMVGRLADPAPGTMRRITVGGAEAILYRTADGGISAFHNSCRHRRSNLSRAEVEPLGKLVICPYDAFPYAALDGQLVSTGHAVPTDDFRRQDHKLVPL